jgi:hypothetical protein
MPAFLIKLSQLYEQQIYIEASSQEEASQQVLQGLGIPTHQKPKFIKNVDIVQVKETHNYKFD